MKILVLGTADWDQPIATNQHYVVRELSHDFEVTYVESLGLRQPELRWRDLKRMANRLVGRRAGSSRAGRSAAGIRVLSPKVIPRHVGLAGRINRPRVRRLVREWLSDPQPKLLWTYSPVTYGLEQFANATVYHCVDLLGEVEGIRKDLIHRSESTIAKTADVALASSGRVGDHLRDAGFMTVLSWPNVADTAAIALSRPADQDRPIDAVFAGNLSPHKVDFTLIHMLLEAGLRVALAGPIAEGGGTALSAVRALERAGAEYRGMLTMRELADLYWRGRVGVVPYVLNSYTTGVSPLKTYEYLAAGLAVVSTPIPAVQADGVDVFVESTSEAFVESVVTAARSTTDSDVGRRIALADGHSWNARGAEARALAKRLGTRS